MPRTAFLSSSFQHQGELKPALETITEALKGLGIASMIFAEEYRFAASEETQMMELACREIAQTDLVIAEVSHKAIGVGVEVGYAIGIGKPVVYVRQVDAEHSTTVAGIATHRIIYTTPEDLRHQLISLFSVIF